MLLLAPVLMAAVLQPAGGPPNVGPNVGDPLPSFEAKDQEGRTRSFDSLKGRNGLVLVFFRSADW
jgi:hypothetical protein